MEKETAAYIVDGIAKLRAMKRPISYSDEFKDKLISIVRSGSDIKSVIFELEQAISDDRYYHGRKLWPFDFYKPTPFNQWEGVGLRVAKYPFWGRICPAFEAGIERRLIYFGQKGYFKTWFKYCWRDN